MHQSMSQHGDRKDPVAAEIASGVFVGLNLCMSHLQVKILRADSQVYVAETDKRILMKMGPGKYAPPSAEWSMAAQGKRWAIWEQAT